MMGKNKFLVGSVLASLIFNEAKNREWKPLIGSIINKTKADIVPVRFFGKNSLFFHTMGLWIQDILLDSPSRDPKGILEGGRHR